MMQKRFTAALALAGLLVVVQIAAADGPLFGGCCPDACGEKVCRPTVENKSVVKRCYDDVCVDFCYPRCPSFSLFSLFGGGCGGCGGCDTGCDSGCADGHCGRVRTKKVLVVKLPKHDECVNKCVVEVVSPTPCAPACSAPCQTIIVAPPAHASGNPGQVPMALPPGR